MSDALTQCEEEAVLERIVRNQLLVKEIEEETALLKQFVKDRPEIYAAGTTKTVGRFYVKVSTNQRIDNELAARHLNSALFKRVSKTVIDPVVARRHLSAADLAKITKVYDNRIEVGLV